MAPPEPKHLQRPNVASFTFPPLALYTNTPAPYNDVASPLMIAFYLPTIGLSFLGSAIGNASLRVERQQMQTSARVHILRRGLADPLLPELSASLARIHLDR